MRKRILSLLLCIVMALSLLPTVAFAEKKVSFPLSESGYYDASGNPLLETPSDHYVHYDAATKTITMKNVAISDSHSDDITVFDLHDSGTKVNVVLIGSNSIKISEGFHSMGIYTAALEITSEEAASLDITVKGSPYAFSHAIRCTSLTVSGKAKVSCSADFDVGSGQVYGIRAGDGKITMKNEAQLEIIGAKGATAGFDWGDSAKLNVGEGYDAVIMAGDSKAAATEKPYAADMLMDTKYFSVAPKGSAPEPEPTNYPVWVNGEQFTNNNAKSGIKCGTWGRATLDTTTTPWTVTLNNAEITDLTVQCPSYADYYSGGIYSEKDIIINLVGRNLIKIDENSKIVSGVTDAQYANNGGISGENIDVTVTGSGLLEFDVTNFGAIYLEGDLHGNHGSFTMDGGRIKGTADWMYINGRSGFAFRDGSFELYSADPESKWWGYFNGSITVDADTRYEMSMCIYPEDQDTPVWESCTIEEYENFYYTYDYQPSGFRIAPKLEPITQIDVTGFTEPVYGAYPDLELSVPDDAHYSITRTSWYSQSTIDGSSDWESLNIFDNPDKEYYMQVTLTAEEGYCFSGENATLNGSQQDISRCYCYPDSFTIETIRYTVTPPTPTNYTVSFNMNGHGDSITAQTVNKGEKASKPADPTASGWTFDGWYTNDACTTAFDFNTPITGNTTVYAKWTKNTVMLGDVDGNGKINMVDVTKLRQYLTNKTKYPLAVEAAADVDGSGKINMVDVTKIRQYLTNKDKYPLG